MPKLDTQSELNSKHHIQWVSVAHSRRLHQFLLIIISVITIPVFIAYYQHTIWFCFALIIFVAMNIVGVIKIKFMPAQFQIGWRNERWYILQQARLQPITILPSSVMTAKWLVVHYKTSGYFSKSLLIHNSMLSRTGAGKLRRVLAGLS